MPMKEINSKKFIQEYCYRLKVGECINFSYRLFHMAFQPDHCWGGIYQTTRQAFLSSMIGSAWGKWTVWFDQVNMEYVRVCKHETTNKRVYVDPDREHLFDNINGELIFKNHDKKN